ncbi:MAG TPA: hypothetical protein VL093_08740 [Flavipsychrobacter sp.]|nr:hypothetical protein [Flavipsychrobacter sp.]
MKQLATGVNVLRTTREMSTKTLNPHHRIFISDIISEMRISSNSLLVLLTELGNRGLIKVYKSRIASVSLTRYGNQEYPLPGLQST